MTREDIARLKALATASKEAWEEYDRRARDPATDFGSINDPVASLWNEAIRLKRELEYVVLATKDPTRGPAVAILALIEAAEQRLPAFDTGENAKTIARLEGLAREATPGEWVINDERSVKGSLAGNIATCWRQQEMGATQPVYNAVWIAAACPHNLAPIIAELRDLKAFLGDAKMESALYERGLAEGRENTLREIAEMARKDEEDGALIQPRDLRLWCEKAIEEGRT